MTLEQLHTVLNTLWVVWFLVLFGGIAVWAMRPARRRSFDAARQIPLQDLPPRASPRDSD